LGVDPHDSKASPTLSANPAMRLARVAGLLYLAIIVLGVWSDGVIRSSIVVSGSPSDTAANIQASVTSFRWSLVADSVMVLCDVALAVLLLVLLRPVSNVLAMTAAAFRLTQSAILGINLLNQHVATRLVTAPEAAGALDEATRNALALTFAEAQGHGYDIGLLFFGINCLLTGTLVYRSGFLPRFIGVLVAASGPVYLVGSYLSLLAPHAATSFDVAYVLPLVAELALCLWLLVRGVDVARWEARAATVKR